jgi:D-serine deaminase-like pyridoxal phosphate-dependent protein
MRSLCGESRRWRQGRRPDFPVGTVVYAVPRHVCSTMAMYSDVVVVHGDRAGETWPVQARARRISV